MIFPMNEFHPTRFNKHRYICPCPTLKRREFLYLHCPRTLCRHQNTSRTEVVKRERNRSRAVERERLLEGATEASEVLAGSSHRVSQAWGLREKRNVILVTHTFIYSKENKGN